MMLPWLLLLLGGAWLVARLSQRDRGAEHGFGDGRSGRRSLDILRERYARGEITREQYDQMRGDLQE